jgi:hypothetical protein
VCARACVYVCMNEFMYMYVCVYICMYVCMCVCTYVCICMYVCIYVCMYEVHASKLCNFQWKPFLIFCVMKHKENHFLTIFSVLVICISVLSFATVDCD